jgi:hypothetical protein
MATSEDTNLAIDIRRTLRGPPDPRSSDVTTLLVSSTHPLQSLQGRTEGAQDWRTRAETEQHLTGRGGR